MNTKIESLKDVSRALVECACFLGSYWPGHAVDGRGMAFLQEAYAKVKDASVVVTILDRMQDKLRRTHERAGKGA